MSVCLGFRVGAAQNAPLTCAYMFRVWVSVCLGFRVGAAQNAPLTCAYMFRVWVSVCLGFGVGAAQNAPLTCACCCSSFTCSIRLGRLSDCTPPLGYGTAPPLLYGRGLSPKGGAEVLCWLRGVAGPLLHGSDDPLLAPPGDAGTNTLMFIPCKGRQQVRAGVQGVAGRLPRTQQRARIVSCVHNHGVPNSVLGRYHVFLDTLRYQNCVRRSILDSRVASLVCVS